MSHPRLRTTATALATAGVTATMAIALAAPAHAGGPGSEYVFGPTEGKCNNNLYNTVKLYRANDYEVTGIHACRLAGDGKRWFGDFVANPR